MGQRRYQPARERKQQTEDGDTSVEGEAKRKVTGFMRRLLIVMAALFVVAVLGFWFVYSRRTSNGMAQIAASACQ